MKISFQKQEKISEQILAFLFSKNPKPFFTAHIAQELARDEEFIKKLLQGLRQKKLIVEIKKNSKGTIYKRRSRWKLTHTTYQAYSSKQ